MSDVNPAAFTGSIPENYDRGLGPVLFAPYAEDLALRVSARPGDRVLELAAGTGILTEQLVERLGPSAAIIATDLNDEMLAVLRRRIGGGNVVIQTADALELPFDDGSIDAIACQFGVMFFPDKVQAMKEAHRVLRQGGRFTFNVWDSLAHNDFARYARETIGEMFAGNPPKFYEVPFGYFDTDTVSSDLRESGFVEISFERVTKDCTGPSAERFCEGLVEGNPIVMELQALGDTAVAEAKAELLKRFTNSFGDAPFHAKMQSIVFGATRP